jgi:dTDP-4-amino-4,6-dideoxygalactose transaminase
MLQPAYNGLIDKNEVITKYPNARKITTDTFFLGTSPVITSTQLDYVQSIVESYFKTI